ncbi:MAG: SDR family NAD(P)-dependent oxidoreductase [Gammaproteobacteria bacterium]|nr:SDR family NAD(P)-dependent oxidoreductase [Gammaproteobacteria bacterium]
MKISGQIALVTGGASGLGQACVEQLLSQGARVVVWDQRKPETLIPDVVYQICDVASITGVEQAMQHMLKDVGAPRILIQCAGILGAGRMNGKAGPMPMAQFKKVMDVNLIGAFQIMSLVSAQMMLLPLLEEERGVIINTASIAAFEGQIGQMAYSASKGGIVAMTLPAARELASFAIRVNTIAPGLMETPMLQGMTPEIQARLIESCVFPNRLGKPSEFAALAQHLIENTLMNGEVVRLDGGIRLKPR